MNQSDDAQSRVDCPAPGKNGAGPEKRKVLIVSDSHGMPRADLPYEDTWIFRIKEFFPCYDFIDRPASGSTTVRLVTEGGGGVTLLERYRPDTVILQMGLAECAPRLFRKKGIEHYFITRVLNAYWRNKYIGFVRRRRVRNPEITYVPPEQFRANLENYFSRAEALNASVIIILIGKPSSLLVRKSPHVKKNIDLYNSIYRETARRYRNVQCIDPLNGDIDIDSIALDDIHINHIGSAIIAEALKKIL